MPREGAMCSRAGRTWLFVALGLSLLGLSWGDNFRYGDIRWAGCFRGAGDFYDPRFPEVCSDRSSRLRVGFTITGVWSWANSATSMLQNSVDDKKNFDDGACQKTVRGCKLRIDRNKATPTNERRIGYRLGLSDGTTDQTVPTPALASQQNDQNSIIGCPIKNGGPALCPNQETSYDFAIDRVSMDQTNVYARYSFEIVFPSEGDYTVFFEGCCRPVSQPSLEYTLNNPSLTFHIRTGVSVRLQGSTFPVQSFRWTMPDTIDLRYLGIRGANDVCGDPQCSAVSVCSLKFQLQGYHPQDAFASSVKFRFGNTLEMGRYKCVEHAPLTNPTPQTPNVMVSNGRCPQAMLDQINLGQDPFSRPFSSAQDMSIDENTGIVTFSVRQPGMWQMTIMAYVTVSGKTLSTPIDLLVRVSETPGNGNPPKLSTTPNSNFNFIDIIPSTTRSTAVTVQCGRSTWMLGGSYTQEKLRVGFKDDDTTCTNSPQFVAWITQSHDLPKGVVFSKDVAPAGNFTRLNSGPPTPVERGLAYLDLFWRPQCEDLSQIGMFMWCFSAKDGFAGSGFMFLYSAPSQVSSQGLVDSSCVFINSQGPPATNPPPVYQTPTRFLTCNAGCCSCCGELGCRCDTGGVCNACNSAYAEAKSTFSYTIRAVDTDPFTKINFRLSFPVGGFENYLSLADLTFTLANQGVAMPRLETTLKYGCNGASYDDCVSDPTKTSDATTKIVWTLPANRDVITINAFKVCYQAVEEVSPFVDVSLWNKTYGTLPNSDSCQVCFVLNVANQPRWMDQFGALDKPVCEGGQISQFAFAVGQTQGNVIRLESEDTAPNQNIIISVLADPGAPNGVVLGPMTSLIDAAGTVSNKQYGRTVTFTPSLGQEDTDYPMCFQAQNSNGLKSKTCCVNLRVFRGDPFWALSKQWDHKQGCWTSCPWSSTTPSGKCMDVEASSTCPASGVLDVTVGCNYKTSVSVKMNNVQYNPKLRVQRLPSCDNCVPGGISVTACEAGMMNTTGCCGNGRCEGAETGMNCPEDCPADMATLSPHPSYPTDPNWAEFSFTPSRAQQGRTVLTCIEVYDTTYGTRVVNHERQGSKAPSLCLVFNVQSCRYCVPAGATLKSISKHYLLNVDWLRLYNSNPDIPNPNMREIFFRMLCTHLAKSKFGGCFWPNGFTSDLFPCLSPLSLHQSFLSTCLIESPPNKPLSPSTSHSFRHVR